MTDTTRYAVVQDTARRLVDSLAATFDVTITPIGELPGLKAEEIVRLTPADPSAAELFIAFTQLPGVVIRFGRFVDQAFPRCGCDACDEEPEQLAHALTELVHELVSHTVIETARVGWRRYEYRWEIPDHGVGGGSADKRKHADPNVPKGRWVHLPWPRRG